MGVTPTNGGVIPLYILSISRLLWQSRAGSSTRKLEGYSPPDTVLRDRLPDNIHRTGVRARRGGLQPRLGQVKGMADEDA